MDDDVALFIKLVEIANYTKAARFLNITQPTLSRRIKHLEDILGAAIIKRNSRNFELTEQGLFLYEQLAGPIKQQQANLTDFIQNKQRIYGTLIVALPAALSYTFITPKINQFTKLYPQVKLQINYTAQPIDLMRENYNLAVSTIMPVTQSSKVRLLKKFSFKLYASPNYIKQYGEPKCLDDLKQHKGIGMINIDGTVINKYRFMNLATGEEDIYETDFNLCINNVLHGIQLAKSGDYIVGIFDGLVDRELESGELVKILENYILGELPCYLIRNNFTSSKLEQAFSDFILSCFADQREE